MTQDRFAVRVVGVSKIYRLWNTSRVRWIFPLKRIFAALIPSRWLKMDAHELSSYHEFYALNNISFDILKGESWGFIGVNGSGKSTLLKIISGNLRPSKGFVEVDGKVVVLDYGNGFNGDFTGKENIYIKAALLGLTKKQINERYHSIIEFAELSDFIDQPVKTYSSGMVSRLGFAIIAHVDADIIITDEALAVGDVFFVQKCMRFIRDFLKKGTFLFVSHSTNDVVSLCKHAIWLERGVIKAIGLAAEVTSAYMNDKCSKNENLSLEKGISSQKTTKRNENIQSMLGLEQPMLSELNHAKCPKISKDLHFEYINRTNLRNDIQITPYEFDNQTGLCGVKISNVRLCDDAGIALSWVVGGEAVTLAIHVVAQSELSSPVVGFQFMDNLGQVLFADNSYLLTQKQPFVIKAGTVFMAEFTFQMPALPVNKYSIRAAVAMETDNQMHMLHAIDRALSLYSVASHVEGLIGVPMESISISNNIIINQKHSFNAVQV